MSIPVAALKQEGAYHFAVRSEVASELQLELRP